MSDLIENKVPKVYDSQYITTRYVPFVYPVIGSILTFQIEMLRKFQEWRYEIRKKENLNLL